MSIMFCLFVFSPGDQIHVPTMISSTLPPSQPLDIEYNVLKSIFHLAIDCDDFSEPLSSLLSCAFDGGTLPYRISILY